VFVRDLTLDEAARLKSISKRAKYQSKRARAMILLASSTGMSAPQIAALVGNNAPTKTRTQWAGPDILVVTLEQTFTPAERSLRRMGEHQRLRDLRLLFQYAEVPGFCEPVERLTGRKVRAFISGIDTEADLATEMFVLHPAGYDGPSRAS
jgi:uncharacterized protein YbcI